MMKKTDDEVENFNNVTNKDVNTLNEGDKPTHHTLQPFRRCRIHIIAVARPQKSV